MKKITLILILSIVVLTACGHKKSTSSSSKNNKKEIGTELPALKNAKEKEIITKTLVFPKDSQGSQQKQIVTYQGKHFQKLVIEKTSQTEDDLKEAIKENGIEEVQKAIETSFLEDEEYAQAKTLKGFTSSVTLPNENELLIVSTYDFQQLDVNKADSYAYFKDMKLKELVKLTPEEYINNLLINGAIEE